MNDKRYELLLTLSIGRHGHYDEAVSLAMAFPPQLQWAVRDTHTGAIYDPALDAPDREEPQSLRVADRG